MDRPRRAKTYAPALGSPARWLPSTDAPPSHTSCSWAEEKEKRGKELLLSSRATLGSLPGIQTLRNEKLHSNGFVGAGIQCDSPAASMSGMPHHGHGSGAGGPNVNAGEAGVLGRRRSAAPPHEWSWPITRRAPHPHPHNSGSAVRAGTSGGCSGRATCRSRRTLPSFRSRKRYRQKRYRAS